MALLPKVWPTDDVTWELDQNAEIRAPPWVCGIRLGMLTRSAVIQMHINIWKALICEFHIIPA